MSGQGYMWTAREWEELVAERDRYWAALAKPLRETIVAVLTTMPQDAAPEHVATQIELQIRAWQAIP